MDTIEQDLTQTHKEAYYNDFVDVCYDFWCASVC